MTVNPSYGGGDVYSQIQSTGALALASGGDNNRLYISSTGNVGIGTTSPSAKLDINGDVRYRGEIYREFSFSASGNYSSGVYYNIVNSSQLVNGMYVIVGYIDTYAAGGLIYYCTFASVPFYWYGVGSNSGDTITLPSVIGTGHAKNNATFPIFRLAHTPSSDGKIYLQFDPVYNWSIMNDTGGRTFQVWLKRLGA